MVSQCLQNNRTDPLTWICRWIHERADLRWYVWGSVRSGTVDQKHNVTWFTQAFRVLIVMKSENHPHLACCSWLSSKNDAFASILDDTYENWCTAIKNTKTHRDRLSSCLHFWKTVFIWLRQPVYWKPETSIQGHILNLVKRQHKSFTGFSYSS